MSDTPSTTMTYTYPDSRSAMIMRDSRINRLIRLIPSALQAAILWICASVSNRGWVVTVCVLCLLAVFVISDIATRRRLRRRDRPEQIDLTEDGVIRLCRGGITYAEIPSSSVAAVKITEEQTWLLISPAARKIGRIYIDSYLIGYSDLLLRLHTLSPKLSESRPTDTWTNSFDLDCEAFAWITAAAVLGLASVSLALHNLIRVPGNPVLYSVIALSMCIPIARRLSRRITRISIRRGRITITKGWLSSKSTRLSDIHSVSIIPPGDECERMTIDIPGERITVLPTSVNDYLSLLIRMKQVAGQLTTVSG